MSNMRRSRAAVLQALARLRGDYVITAIDEGCSHIIEGGKAMRIDFTLALACADAYPEQQVKQSRFKAEIDATTWLITEVSHRLDGSGFGTSLRMEKAA